MSDVKSLLEQVVAQVPQFAADLVELFSGPKRFLAARDLTDPATQKRALIFYVLSMLFAFVLYLPFQPPDANVTIYVTKLLVYDIVSTLAFTFLILLSWKIVGGNAPLKAYFVITLYASAIMTVVVALGALVSKGVFRAYAPDELPAFIDLIDRAMFMDYHALDARLLEAGVLPWALLVFLIVGLIPCWTYIVLFWGSYRQLNGLSRARSCFAFLACAILSQPWAFLVGLGARAMDLMIF